ncbi:MAG: hypothetical protein AB8B53_08750 [Flavobacteriales bacterium]
MNIKNLYIIILLTHLTVLACSQVVHVEINNDGQVEITPSQEFLKEKKVTRVSYEYSTKKPNQIIKSNSDSKTETYNSSGKLLELKQRNHIAGTTVKSHIKNDYVNGKLSCKLEKDHIGYIRTYFSYSGDTIFEHSYRAAHYDPQENTTIPLDSTFINSSYSVTRSNVTRYFNKNGLHIKTTYTERDSLNLLASERLTYTLSAQKILRTYSYNAEGLCSGLSLTHESGTKTFKYFYDHMNVLERMEEWEERKNVIALELVYNANGWLDAIIRQNPENNHIKITKLSYKTD